MNLLAITSAVVWVDFFTILLSKYRGLGQSINEWYSTFGIMAIISDCLVIILGIMIAYFIFPQGDMVTILLTAIIIQLVHDYLFYIGVILPIPAGHNSMIDLFKKYANENSWKILLADSIMIGSSVVFAHYLAGLPQNVTSFIGLLGVYSLTYVTYTRNV